ncbi:hypothetical protein CC1G_10963 [Coprinopsis cinerea okayama7|uniref:F-box domain-containing protein n=1 Tax=Coprinopsis cinerea (strain Okayama-7 / 130 / ATCC MYA-4618 / FGSC 9003) TaxID=240176 RepID=A8PC02_COPC7|nr:hypothetical protein CC1G_10963 [Coprinopsis cinerea okayama7\|eukprot:XP_001840300.2 hypothetical protein CC1G_10963 [Coprinopsis cinerea okayama7\
MAHHPNSPSPSPTPSSSSPSRRTLTVKPTTTMFPDPPTRETLASARRALEAKRASIQALSGEIDAAEKALAEIVRESRCAINQLEEERARLVEEEMATLAYLSPLRRLPQELVREIFMWCFEEHPCCAWILAAVCTSWRRLALRMPLLWSKIRLITTPSASADTIRLWLERSGDVVPLDIEIFLRVAPPALHNHDAASSRRGSINSLTGPSSSSVQWASPPPNAITPAAYVAPQPTPPPPAAPANGGGTTTTTAANVSAGAPGTTPTVIPQSSSPHDPWNVQQTTDRTPASASKISMHWGHIAFFYLGEQMHRWERFIFRFDRQFTSMGALKSINGDAPLLKEFEVSSAEAGFYVEWPWLPNCGDGTPVVLPKLRSVTLQHTPFKWSSPMLRNLEHLTLRATPTSHLPLDRIQGILMASPALKTLSIHFQGVLPPILAMSPLTLPELTEFSVGGHYLLTQLVDTLVLPALTSLTIDIESRDPIEDSLSTLLTRSCSPPLQRLSIAYGTSSSVAPFYYGPGGIVISWNILSELTHLRTLEVGGTPFESLLSALGPPDDDHNPLTTWACPNLENLSMKNCHSHGEGVAKLVGLVEARNPPLGGGGAGSATGVSVGGVVPGRLKRLELLECPSLGVDVVRWLASRIENWVDG